MITSFSDVFAELKEKGICKRMVAAWAVDEHTIEAASKAVDLGFIKATLVGDAKMINEVCEKHSIDASKFDIVDNPDELKAVAQAVQLVHDGQGDVLMKGLCSTDKFLRAILNKETGLLPPKALLSHVGIIESPNYHKLLFLTDMAVVPLPDLKQKMTLANYVVKIARSFGIAKPKVAFIAASEQVLASMPACLEAAALAKMTSPVAGDADCLVFPNIESANVFWKTNSKLATGVRQAGMLVGTTAPCILASRADSVDTKLNSIAEAVMSVK